MLTEFIGKKLKSAKYKLLKDGSYFGVISGLQGVWANAKTLEACRVELQEVLEDWLVLQLRDRRKINGLEVKASKIKNFKALSYA
jgi:predicted RNase H-like HicB family nuclease